MGPAGINRKYKSRILKFLRQVREALVKEGFTVDEPFDMTADEFWYAILVRKSSKPDESATGQDVDISFKIAESEQHDGEKGGVNFMLDIVEWGGRILGGFTPYNYTSNVWVSRNSEGAIERRFKMMEQVDIDEIVNLVRAA
jgi:hypothetical protein